MITVETLWHDVAENLKRRLNLETYERWIAVIKPQSFEENNIVLAVSNDFYLWWMEEHYKKTISEAASAVCGKPMEARFVLDASIPTNVVEEKKATTIRKSAVSRKSASNNNVTGAALNPKHIFESFVVGPSNDFSHACALAVAQAPGRAYNPLFLYGGIGLGKTHLMQAIGNYISSHSSNSVCCVTCETMMNEYINSLQNKNTNAFRRKYRNVDVLLVDDVHFLTKKDGLQEEFHHTFNQLFNARKQIIMTSDKPPSEIAGLEKRLVSRFEWGQVADLGPPTFETRVAILRSKQKDFNVILPEEVVNFIASRIRSNIRKLEGALTRITGYASIYGKAITLELVEQQLQCLLEQERTERASISSIQRKVADHFDVRVSDMTGVHRNQSISLPRHIAMYLCRTMTPSSFPEIGAAFEKTHATVLHAHRLIEKKRKLDPQINQLIVKLSKELDPTSV